MDIYGKLVNLTSNNAEPVKKIIMGVHWTLVESLTCGLASTQIEPPPHFYKQIKDAGKLEELAISELAHLLYSDKWLEATIGLAAINSSILIDENQCIEENAYHAIVRAGKDKNIGIIGHFPFVSRLKDIAKNLYVLELQPRPGDFPADLASELLPQCDVVGITATTLINHTFNEIMANCSSHALKVMIGPSTPMTPILFDYGIDILAGCKVLNSDTVHKQIQQGANFKQISDVKVLTMKKEKSWRS